MAFPRVRSAARSPWIPGLLVSPALGTGSGVLARVWLGAPSEAAVHYAAWVTIGGYVFAALVAGWVYLPKVVTAWSEAKQAQQLCKDLHDDPKAVAEAYDRLLRARLGSHAIEQGAINSPDIVRIATGQVRVRAAKGRRAQSPGRTKPVS
ncbi:hypothetical protein ABZ297_12170 [Nonomuraea sp. NPDC005983]|uniref:hypothetical protein n=1 Tax=Nonomuraea sp. NPDC005983 TaxID=3155595 RepID=UPI0033B83791